MVLNINIGKNNKIKFVLILLFISIIKINAQHFLNSNNILEVEKSIVLFDSGGLKLTLTQKIEKILCERYYVNSSAIYEYVGSPDVIYNYQEDSKKAVPLIEYSWNGVGVVCYIFTLENSNDFDIQTKDLTRFEIVVGGWTSKYIQKSLRCKPIDGAITYFIEPPYKANETIIIKRRAYRYINNYFFTLLSGLDLNIRNKPIF